MENHSENKNKNDITQAPELDKALMKYLNGMYDFFRGDIDKFIEVCKIIEEVEGEKYSTTSANGENLGFITFCDEKYYRLTIPITTTLFAVADVLGFLLSDNHYRETSKNLELFFTKKPILGLGNNSIPDFINLIRNGIVHSYFPKYIMPIQFHTYEIRNSLFVKNDKYNLIELNVNYLIKYVDSVFQEILEEAKTNLQFKKQFDILMSDYKSVYDDFIVNLSGIE